MCSIAIDSTSAVHAQHHARWTLRPRRINNESVSRVIFVSLTKAFFFPVRSNLWN